MITDPPTIKITMSGLLLLYFKEHDTDLNKFKECQVLVHRGDPKTAQHGFRVFVHEIKPPDTRPDNTNVVLELAKQVTTDDLILDVTDPGIPGTAHDVTGIVHYPAESGPFAAEPQDDVFPFSRIPDVEGPRLHDKKIPFTVANRQIIRLNNGAFYTATQPLPEWTLRREDGFRDFNDSCGLDTGINIYLKDSESSSAVLTYGDYRRKTFEFKAKPNTRYEIIILNDRLAPLEADHDMNFLHENDFNLYYQFLSVADNEKFSMVFPPLPGHPLSKAHPCGNVRCSKTQVVKP